MRSGNVKQLIDLGAKLQEQDPIAAAVVECTEVGVVVPSLLLKKLEEHGYSILITQKTHVVQVDIKNTDQDAIRSTMENPEVPDDDLPEEILIASGTDADQGQALLCAVLGYLREENHETSMRGLPPTDASSKSKTRV